MKRSSERGSTAFTLIEILVVAAIGIALAMALIPRYTGAGKAKAGPGEPPTPVQRAQSVECMTNLTQIRQALTMSRSMSERNPASLQELTKQGVTTSMLVCPVGGSQYAYRFDPATGQVGCPYPGHERY